MSSWKCNRKLAERQITFPPAVKKKISAEKRRNTQFSATYGTLRVQRKHENKLAGKTAHSLSLEIN